MSSRNSWFGMIVAGTAAASAAGAIPVPDAVVYGTLDLDGMRVSATDSITVIARVGSLDAPVAAYRMGSIPTAGDRFVLHFPQSTETGKTIGEEEAGGPLLAGATAKLSIKRSGGTEVYLTEFIVPPSGTVKKLNVQASAADTAALAESDRPAGGLCGSGAGGCGAIGMTSMGLSMLGLARMKRHRARNGAK